MIIYSKYNSNRKEEFQLTTTIEKEEGALFSSKIALPNKAQPFLNSFFDKYDYLKNGNFSFEPSIPLKKRGNKVIFEYKRGSTLDFLLFDKYQKNDKEGFIELLKNYLALLKKNKIQKNNVSEDFIKIFGKGDLVKFECIDLGCLDLNFDNIILSQSQELSLIDYEWTFKFPIPYKYICFRAVIYFFSKHFFYNLNKNFISMDEVFSFFDINHQDKKDFIRFEYNFQKFISKELVEPIDIFEKNYLFNQENFLIKNYVNSEEKEKEIKYKTEELEKKDLDLLIKDKEIETYRKELLLIYSSRGWRLVLVIRKILEVLIPKGGYRRKLAVCVFGLLKKVFKLILKIRKICLHSINLMKKSIVILRRDGLLSFVKKVIKLIFRNKIIFTQRRTNRVHKAYLKKISSFFNIKNNGIVVISHDATNTGAPLLALNIVKSLNVKFKKNVIVILLQGGPLEGEFKKYGTVFNLSHLFLGSITNREFNTADYLFKELAGMGINKCVCNTVLSGVLMPSLKKYNFLTINLVHEQPGSIKKYNYFEATEKVLYYADKIVFSSKFVKDDFEKNFKKINKKLIVQPQGIYLENSFKDKKEEARILLRKKLNIDNSARIILGCGYGHERKGPDLFFEIANQITSEESELQCYFVWLGEWDEMLKNKLIKIAKEKDFLSRIILADFEKDPSIFFAGADVYLLTSREDPFPSVVLESMDCGTPVVVFDKTGGAREVLINNQGVIVPHLDTKGMTKEVVRLLKDKEYYKLISKNAKRIVKEKFIFEDYVRFLIDQVQDDNKNIPQGDSFKNIKVSVVVPNYNYENYLEERLTSIVKQTHKPFEIIFLDDNSQDNSVEVAREILSSSDIPYKIIKNIQNEGCFSQWSKGIREASGDLVWIAEADDFCEINLLENLVPKFVDDKIVIAYCQSKKIDEKGKEVEKNYLSHTDDISKEKWKNDYVEDGVLEILNAMCIKNTIPNASAVVFRKVDLDFKKFASFKTAGDWFFYILLLLNGDIYYAKKILNSHRRHSKSITSSFDVQRRYEELVYIQNFVMNKINLSSDNRYKLFKHRELVYKNDISFLNKKEKINICFSSDDNYVNHLAATIASVLKNSSKEDEYNIYILDGGIKPENKEKISKIKNIRDFNLEYIQVSKEDFKACPITSYASYITLATYYRFKIPTYLKEVDKVLYMDCDMIVNKDIKELFITNIEDFYLAAVPEVCNHHHKKRLEIGDGHFYFNAGLLLINNKKWREDKIEDKLFRYVSNPPRKIIHVDQDVLNDVLKYCVTYLPLNWNLQHDAIDMKESYLYHQKERLEAINNPYIIHYTNKHKPWHKECTNKFKNKYFEYLKLTPFN